jgi:hypothetical protein
VVADVAVWQGAFTENRQAASPARNPFRIFIKGDTSSDFPIAIFPVRDLRRMNETGTGHDDLGQMVIRCGMLPWGLSLTQRAAAALRATRSNPLA